MRMLSPEAEGVMAVSSTRRLQCVAPHLLVYTDEDGVYALGVTAVSANWSRAAGAILV